MSITEVADRAGVSKSTVSRVINNAQTVAPEMAQAVKQAMDDLGYRPPMRRRGPKPRNNHGVRTGNLALVVMGENATADLYRLPVMPSLLHGVERAAAEEGLNLILARLVPDGPEPTVLARRGADGLLLMGAWDAVPQQMREHLRSQPAVWIFREHSDIAGEFDHVFYNNDAVGRLAATHLLNRGHRRLAWFNGNPDHQGLRERGAIFEAMARAAGVDVQSATTTVRIDPAYPRGERTLYDEALRSLFDGKDRPTGLFVTTDTFLPGVYRALRNMGCEPGQDIDIVSCDNEPQFLGRVAPKPSTIDINLELVGRRSVQQLIWRIQNIQEPSRVSVLVEPHLVLAASQNGQVNEEKAR